MRSLMFCKMLAIAIAAVTLTSGVQAQGVAYCPMNKVDPPIAGSYLDNFGGLQSVSESFWFSAGSAFEVCSDDNARKRIIAQNDSRNTFDPGKYSRFEWTAFGNRLWFLSKRFRRSRRGRGRRRTSCGCFQSGRQGLRSVCVEYSHSNWTLVQRFRVSNHIRRPQRVCRTKCG